MGLSNLVKAPTYSHVGTDEIDQCAFLLLINIFGKKDPKTKQDPIKFVYNKCKVSHIDCVINALQLYNHYHLLSPYY